MDLTISSPIGYQAALYIRLSKEDENDGPSESVSNQKSMLEEFARQQRLPVYDFYIDDGYSGTSFDRPAFRRMLADIEAHRVNMVITKDLSRLGRDYILTGHYMERYFPEHQVRYLSLLDGIDTGTDSTANDITPFRAILNDMYAKDISRKISSVKHDKQRKGLFIGGKAAYGYQLHPKEKNKIIVDGKAAPIVRRIFEMALEGTSCRQIAMRLNEEGIPAPAAYAGLRPAKPGPYFGLWSGERISAMLQNELYIGNMVQGRSRRVSYKSAKCIRQQRRDWVVVEGTHPPIVGREAFEKVQQLIASRTHTRSRTYDFLLKGLIFCHECGHPLAVINRKNAKGEDSLYLICRTYQRFTGAGACTSHIIKEQTVTDAVLARVREACGDWLKAQALLPLCQREIARVMAKEESGRALIRLQSALRALDAQMDRAYMDKLEGVLEKTDFQRIYSQMKSSRAALARQIGDLKRPGFSPAQQEELAGKLVARFLEAVPHNRELLTSLIERVELTAGKQLIISFRFGREAGQTG